MGAAHDTEIAELAQRTRALEDAIEKKRRAIRKLQGLPVEGEGGARWWRFDRPVEVTLDLPALDAETMHEALFDAIHRETGLVGAVRTRGEELEWKPFDEKQARRKLEVRLEGGADAPRLVVAGHDPAAATAGAAAAMLGMIVGMGLALGAVSAGLSATWVMALVLLAVAAPIVGLAATTRRRSRRGLRELAQRIEAQLPVSGSHARVELADEDAEEVEVDAAAATRRRSRGVS